MMDAMTYDQIVKAVGPFELAEYLGLALAYAVLLVTPPFQPFTSGRTVRSQPDGA